MPAPRKYTDQEIENAVQLRKTGLSVKEVARKTGIGFGSCRVYLAGVETPFGSRTANIAKVTGAVFLSPEDEQRVCEDYLRTFSAKKTAENLSLSPARVKRCLTKRGVTLPKEIVSKLRSENGVRFHRSAEGAKFRERRAAEGTAWKMRLEPRG